MITEPHARTDRVFWIVDNGPPATVPPLPSGWPQHGRRPAEVVSLQQLAEELRAEIALIH